MGLLEVDVAGAFFFHFSVLGLPIGMSWAAMDMTYTCRGLPTDPPRTSQWDNHGLLGLARSSPLRGTPTRFL